MNKTRFINYINEGQNIAGKKCITHGSSLCEFNSATIATPITHMNLTISFLLSTESSKFHHDVSTSWKLH